MFLFAKSAMLIIVNTSGHSIFCDIFLLLLRTGVGTVHIMKMFVSIVNFSLIFSLPRAENYIHQTSEISPQRNFQHTQ